MKRTVLLLSPLKKGSGNNTGIQRIRRYIEENDQYTCLIKDPADINECIINQLILQHNVTVVLAIHAYRSGRLLTNCSVPIILILGGTDINEFSKYEDKLQIMNQVVFKSRFIVAFSSAMVEKAKALWSFLRDDKIVKIKQAVITNPSSFSLLSHLQSNGVISSTDGVKIFVIVGAIRPVKSPLYIIKEVSEWHKTRKDVFLVIIGPETDAEYQKYFLDSISGLSGVYYIPGLSLCDAHAAIKESFAVVNTSESEGMAAVILEAMQMGVPVLARDNYGNKSLIQDGVTGFIFDSPKMFIEKANLLLDNKDLKTSIVSNAAVYVEGHHSTAVEKEMYLKLLSDAV